MISNQKTAPNALHLGATFCSFYLVPTLVRLVDEGVECQSRRSASTHAVPGIAADQAIDNRPLTVWFMLSFLSSFSFGLGHPW